MDLRKSQPNKQKVYSKNRLGSTVEGVGTFRLVLKSGFHLDLKDTFYVPTFSRNLVSISRLAPLGFKFVFENTSFSLFQNSIIVGHGVLVDRLYKFDLDPTHECYLSDLHGSSIGNKHCNVEENSSKLWHKRLGHISIERLKILVNDGVLLALDFTDFGTRIDCIKGKQTNKTTKGAKRSSDILEIINTGIYGPFPASCLNGQRYFISFIDCNDLKFLEKGQVSFNGYLWEGIEELSVV